MNKTVLLMALILVSGCVNFTGAFAEFKIIPTKSVSLVEDVTVAGEAAPDVVLEKRKTTLFFDAANQGNTTIVDVTLDVTDLCLLTPTFAEDTSVNFGTFRPQDSETHELELTAPEVDLEQTCNVRYALTYLSSSAVLADVAVVSDSELTRLNREGEASAMRIFEVRTATPVEIDFRVSKDQPIPEGTPFFVYFQLFDRGAGIADPIAAGNLQVTYPADIVQLDSCDDLQDQGGVLVNAKEIKFFERESKAITCRFTTVSGGIVSETGTFEAVATYTYTLRGEVPVTVKPE